MSYSREEQIKLRKLGNGNIKEGEKVIIKRHLRTILNKDVDIDYVHEFVSNQCNKVEDGKVKAIVLFEEYIKWCFENKIKKRLGRNTFYGAIQDLGYFIGAGSNNTLIVHGLELKEEFDDLEDL